MKEKSPAFQWYPKQWLGDDKVLGMDWDARGMHHWLLNLSWQQDPRGSLPNDTAVIRRWLGSPSDDVWRRVWPQIMSAWFVQDDRLVNAGMCRAAQKQENYSRGNKGKEVFANGTQIVRKQHRKSTEDEDEVLRSKGFELPDWISKETWDAYEEMRKALRKTMTDKARSLVVSKLSKLRDSGNDPNLVLEQSIQNSWQGVFELKEKPAAVPLGVNTSTYQELTPEEKEYRRQYWERQKAKEQARCQ